MNFTRVRTVAIGAALVVLATSSTTIPQSARAGAGVTLAISQVPLTVASPVHPQVLIALGNAESMDGTLSGAIMTGSGVLASGVGSLSVSSSPASYAVPAGFVPPLQAADASGNTPYTVSSNGTLFDNGASRLNVAKAGIKAIVQAYMQNTDFALETYSTSGTSLYTTWVYYMSPTASGFVFTSSKLAGSRYVANPCLSYALTTSTIKANCTEIAGKGLYAALAVSGSTYLQIGASSDDANINDVLYASGQPGVYINYGNTSPATPYPPGYSLANYNNGSILITYPSSVPSANRATGPTNAGYVPYSPQVMYAQRGFGYGGNQAAGSGNVLVPMTSAGTVPTASSVTTAVNAFLAPLAPETNTLQSTEIKAVAGQAPTAGLLARAQSYLASVLSTGNCAPKQYVVLISDGLPTQDLAGKYWPPLGSAAAAGYGLTASFKADGSLNATNDTALTDTITNLAKLKTAGINTYVIGLGAGVDPSANPQAAATLQAMAIAGGTANYYPASSPAALVDGLNNILVSVQSGALSTTAAAVNSSRLQAGSVEYQASFNSTDTPYQDWTGDIFEKAIDRETGLPGGATLWSAQILLDAKASGSGWSSARLIAIWNPALNGGTGAAVPLLWSALSTAQQALLQPSDALGSARVDYLRGNTLLEKRNGGAFRNRSHLLGDIANSQSAYVGAPSAAYFSDSYRAFARAKANRQPMLYAGANDGMLHAINATTGIEQFAFIPNEVVANLRKLTEPLYNQSHLFYVDGSPQAGDVQFADASWHTLLVGGEGGGGKSIYAMDVTNPQTLTSEAAVSSAVLWEFVDVDMGLSYSEPQITPIVATPGFAVFFGNGYNSPNNKSVLYAVNPKTGQLLRKIDLCAAVPGACDINLPQGLSTVAQGHSDGLQGVAMTQIYAGDLQGNLWAIDVADQDTAKWTARLLFKARDASGNVQPITTPPVVTLHPNYPRLPGQFVLFGTGQLLTAADLSSQLKQSVYGIWDKPVNTSVPPRANLQAQTLTLVSAGASGLPQDVLTATNTSINWTTKLGWYDDLVGIGERVINAPQLLNGAFLATLNTPPGGACNAAFNASLLEVNFKTGGAFEQPQLDINGDKVIDARDTVNGTFPVGVALGTGYGSAATLLKTTGSPGKIGKLITKSGGQQVTIIDPNNTPRRLTWWQLQ